MFECATCGYQTKRKWSFDYHNSRKTPCKPKNINDNVKKNVNNCENVKKNNDIINKFVNLNVKEETVIPLKTSYALTCPICLKLFKTRAAKSIH